ncbi:YfiR family protein [Coraliomargarita algicola]|uniref:YfiR family protein n=1 Tax=Coraliomargarita algicola TaxID=3092156 RepID=A0ABZ0RQW3_9BACT|nr:YfiR family protein [Coraliomargarita sp. J2-16]WPJ97543.1 YfiR family protein [Coraliomargarita sp. J2-16]
MALSTNVGTASNDRAIIEENDGKALLIYNIAKFTVWPSEGSNQSAPFIFTLWNDHALSDAFRNIEGLQAQGRPIRINHHEQDRAPIDCKVLVIPGHQLQAFIQSKELLLIRPVLTVTTDTSVFEAGAMVLIEVLDDHLSFSVNLAALKASGLEISGNLLRHARKVNF